MPHRSSSMVRLKPLVRDGAALSARLDDWLPNPAVRTRHEREAAVAEELLWDAARTVRVGDSRILGRLVRWRVPGTQGGQTYHDMFTSPPFLALEEGPTHLFAGICGTIWAARPSLMPLSDREQFRHWRTPGTARVLFAQWVVPTDRGAGLISEVRVDPVDLNARNRLRGIWPLISRFEGLIGSEPLRLATRRAEAR